MGQARRGNEKNGLTGTTIEGGKAFDGTLPLPPDNAGPIEDSPMHGRWTNENSLHFYRDSVVIAYKQPVADAVISRVMTNSGQASAQELIDGKLTNGITIIPRSKSSPAWISLNWTIQTRFKASPLRLPQQALQARTKQLM